MAPLPGTEKFLSGNTINFAYADHIIQFGLIKFLAPLLGTEKFLSGSTRNLAYTDHIIQFGLISRHGRDWLVSWVEKDSRDRIRQLLEITKRERNHELLLSMKNL